MAKTVRVLPAGVKPPQIKGVNIVDSTDNELGFWEQTTTIDPAIETVMEITAVQPNLKKVRINAGTVTITSNGGGPTASIDVDEGDTAVTTVVATQTAPSGTIAYSISGGANAGLFTINSSSGVLAFASPSAEGSYAVTVTATGRGNKTDSQAITVSAASSGYTASAVHFDGSTMLACDTLSCTDNGFLSFSMWLKKAELASYNLFAVDPDNNLFAEGHLNGDIDPGGGTFGFDLNDADFTAELSGRTDTAVTTATWVNLKVSIDSNHAGGAKIVQMYLGDTDITGTVTDASGSFHFAIDGFQFVFGGASDPSYVGDAADIWIAPGQFIDFSVQGNRRKFIDANGKPVSLGADGSTPTSTAPAIFFSGTASGFGTNKGTGGSFTTTGTLTNASTSPSD